MPNLNEYWRLRNGAAQSLLLGEEQMRHAVQTADVADLVVLLESFAPGRSTGPEWARTFEPLVERLWAWCDEETIASLAEHFRARGMPWIALANALSPDQGIRIRTEIRHPAWARLPAFAIA